MKVNNSNAKGRGAGYTFPFHGEYPIELKMVAGGRIELPTLGL